jgi:cobalt-precorrin 5A hydrolase/precorrin-3B C17-methyltransferase
VIGLVYATTAGRAAAARLAHAWGDEAQVFDGPPRETLPRAFAECDGVVAFLAVGASVRLLAPHLADKRSDPGLVCVDEASRYAVAVLGGHGGGANALAARVAAVLGCEPVVTTATDAVGVAGLDTLGWPVEGEVAAVSRAILDGAPVRLVADAVWPLPALPPNVGAHADAAYDLLLTDRLVAPAAGRPTAVLRPPSLVVGVGGSRGVAEAEVLELVSAALADAGLSVGSVRCLATVEAKADEAGIVAAAASLGVPLAIHSAKALADVETPNPSEVVRAVIGTASVAEAAALARPLCAASANASSAKEPATPPAAPAGPTPPAELVVPKRKSAMATVAVARHRPRGRLALVGLGPGARDLLTPRAAEELRRASVVVGLDQYVEQIRDLLRPGTRVLATGLGSEAARAQSAVDEARTGHAVALIGSGDAGIYAMASPALEVAGVDVDVLGVPGVTAALAAAAELGAPLGHDHVYISLSDLHTPWETIERRVRAAAEGDFAVCFYNPRSSGRGWQLPKAVAILAGHRPAPTPVGLVRNASRAGQQVTITTIAEFDAGTADMYTVVIVGSSTTRMVAGRMVTPRGYQWSR